MVQKFLYWLLPPPEVKVCLRSLSALKYNLPRSVQLSLNETHALGQIIPRVRAILLDPSCKQALINSLQHCTAHQTVMYVTAEKIKNLITSGEQREIENVWAFGSNGLKPLYRTLLKELARTGYCSQKEATEQIEAITG